jgi:hypothetical protein
MDGYDPLAGTINWSQWNPTIHWLAPQSWSQWSFQYPLAGTTKLVVMEFRIFTG